MKVLLVHNSDGQKSGGGIAMLRLHFGLRQAGIDSKILCRVKTLDSADIRETPRLPGLDSLLREVTSRLGLNDIHLVSSFKVKQETFYQEADIIDFQGIHSQTLSYLALPALTRDKPAVFTMHDMWAFTGHCVYSYDCERWKTGCGQCPYPDTYPAIKRDNTRLEWRLKKWVYGRSNVVFAAPSKWLIERAQQSMIGQYPIHWIPNGVDTGLFQPLDPAACRAELGIPPDKNVLMFVAMNLSSHRKGGDLLVNALKRLPASLRAETVLLTIGHGGDEIAKLVDIEIINLGYVKDDHRKAVAYSAADLFLFPTRADIFGLVSIESQACGTPVVSFRVGGVPEHVRPGQTGYLAEPEDIDGFRDGIVQLLEDEALRRHMREQCRAITYREYRLELQVQRYIQLYRQLHENGVTHCAGDLITPNLPYAENKP
jgi:glycosyltransferase involved in cell wall biosynthesis